MRLQVLLIRIERAGEGIGRLALPGDGGFELDAPACILCVRLGPWQFVTCLESPVDAAAEDAPGDGRVWLAG